MRDFRAARIQNAIGDQGRRSTDPICACNPPLYIDDQGDSDWEPPTCEICGRGAKLAGSCMCRECGDHLEECNQRLAALTEAEERRADDAEDAAEVTPLTYRQAVARIALGFSLFILAMAAVWMIVSLGRSN